MTVIYIQVIGSGRPARPQSYSFSFGDSIVLTSFQSSNATALPTGPYFVTYGGKAHQAWRLYSDTQGAFTETCVPTANGAYAVLPANIPGQSLAVAVPSRLYYTRTASKPLAGVRIGIKDIFDMTGLRTSNGNRAWYGLYPPASANAVVVQNLIDAGAVLVGKMKTSQFANGESPTADWVDYHSPFNPRGDGYQDPSSSSSGPGAGEGAYDWLDLTLGSDTGGSVRGPSQSQGLFGNRPSWGLVTLQGAMPLAPQLDTPGILARDPELWGIAGAALYKSNFTTTTSFPSEILTVGFPTNDTAPADALLLSFLARLQDFLSASVSPVNLTTAWASANPTLPPLPVFLNATYAVLITKEQTRLVRDPFYADYAARYGGRRPFVNPVPLSRWSYAANTSVTVAQAEADKDAFAAWLARDVLPPSPETCSRTLLLYPGGRGTPSYRNVYRAQVPGVPFGFSSGRVSVFGGGPDVVFPVGEVGYSSNVTGQEERLPVSVDVLAARGCDGMLFELARALAREGVVSASKAGRSKEDGGEILLRRGMEVDEQ